MSDTVLISIALMGLLVFVLGANVTRHRAVRGAHGGNQAPTEPDDALLVAIRAHGNAIEYIPTLSVLLILAAALTDGTWVDILAGAALLSRLLHAVGLLVAGSLAVRSPIKEGGAMLTYLSGAALAVTVLVNL